MVLKLKHALETPERIVKETIAGSYPQFLIKQVRDGKGSLGIYISNKFPGDTDAGDYNLENHCTKHLSHSS